MNAQQKNKNSGGNHMSLTKGASRRVALFASSSLIAAAATVGAALIPTAAAAQATCVSTPAPANNGTNTVTFGAGTYNPAIDCAFVGTAAIVSTAGSITVSSAAPGGGINLTGAGSSAINWTSTAGTVSGGAQTNGAVIEAATASGAININTASVSGSSATVTHGIRAVSSGGGAVNVTVNGSVSATNATGSGLVAGGTAAIEAISTGGNGAVAVSSSSGASGRLFGIVAQASGTGTLTINTGAAATASANFATGVAGIQATTGTGLLTINGFGSGGAGTGVLINAGGSIAFTGGASGTQYGIDIANVAAGATATLDITRGVSGGIAAIRAQGAGTAVVNITTAQTAMNFDFTGMAAPVDVNVKAGGAWRPPANVSTIIPDGNFAINLESGSAFIAGVESSSVNAEPATVLTFSGASSLNNAGLFLIGPDRLDTSWEPMRHEAELRLVGLGEFRHSGAILLGVIGYPYPLGAPRIQGVPIEATDAWYDDMLVFEDGTWIGEDGKILFDVDINRTQLTCAREAVTHDFGAADCLRIIDSTVEGRTYVNVVQVLAGDRGRLTQQIMDEGILLVDAPGSTVTAENFVLDPDMPGYNADFASLDKGLYQYVLLFDEAQSQFRLLGTLSSAGYQLPLAATAAHGLWRVSTGSWFERQADRRGGVEPDVSRGAWLRGSGERTDRDVVNATTLGGLPFSVDSTHRQDTYAVTGGVDVISGEGQGMAYVAGVMGGYAHADIDYEASSDTQAMDAWTLGLYGGLIAGGLYLDAAVNANNVILDTDAPGFGFLPEGTILSSRLVSIGGQVEAGWRLPFGDGLFAEPLASLSYVRSKLDDAQIQPDDLSRLGLEVSYDDPTSLRAGLGGRVGMDQDLGVVRTQFSVLGRVWNEFEGENTAAIRNLAFPTDPDILVVDDFSGQFNEVAVGASVYSRGGTVSGFLNVGGRFGDDYQAKTGSVGVRVSW